MPSLAHLAAAQILFGTGWRATPSTEGDNRARMQKPSKRRRSRITNPGKTAYQDDSDAASQKHAHKTIAATHHVASLSLHSTVTLLEAEYRNERTRKRGENEYRRRHEARAARVGDQHCDGGDEYDAHDLQREYTHNKHTASRTH